MSGGFGKDLLGGGSGRRKDRVMKGHTRRASAFAACRADAAGVILAIILALATICGAGEIKQHEWPCAFLAQTIPDLQIPVVMDVEKVYRFFVFGGAIRLTKVDETTYKGCTTLMVSCTFDLTLTCTIEPTRIVPGDYSCSIDAPDIIAPFGTAKLCAEVQNARVDSLPAGRTSVTVAIIRVRVTPK
jgi:hypothetical protein